MCSMTDDPTQNDAPEPQPLAEDDPRRIAWVNRIAKPSLREGETLPFVKPTETGARRDDD